MNLSLDFFAHHLLIKSALYGLIALVFTGFGTIFKVGSKAITCGFIVGLTTALLFDFSAPFLVYLSGLCLTLLGEWMFPRRVNAHGRAAEDFRLAIYVFVKRSGNAAFLFTTLWLTKSLWLPSLHISARGVPFWAQALIALVALDLKQYWFHRGQHRIHFWWRFHRIHHLTENLNVLANSRTHIGEYFLVRLFSNYLITEMLGLDHVAVLYGYGMTDLIVGGFIAHANIDFPKDRVPLWGYIFSTPNAHAVHHLEDMDKVNFGEILILWDVLFGTFKSPLLFRNSSDVFGVRGERAPASFFSEQILKVN